VTAAHDIASDLRVAAVDAEAVMIGTAIVSPEAVDRARAIVEPEDLSEDLHQRIWRAICDTRDRGDLVSPRLLAAAVGNTQLVAGIDVQEYLHRMINAAAPAGMVTSYAREVRRHADLRRVVGVARDILLQVEQQPSGKPADFAAQAIEHLDAVAASQAGSMARVGLSSAAGSALDEVERVRAGGTQNRTSWGIRSLDRMTQGMHPGQLIVAAGRPGMGKTAFGLQVALNVALRGRTVYFVSLEMVDQELAQRALSALVYGERGDLITYRDISDAKGLTEASMERLRRARARMDAMAFEIEQQAGLTLSQISARARRVKVSADVRGNPLGLVVIDHMGLVRPSGRYAGNRVQEVGELSGGLKVLAKELGVPVLALCQLNRAVESREDKRPSLGDLRDSGSIEQDADIVLGLYREAYYLERKRDRTEAEEKRWMSSQLTLDVEALKLRQGKAGTVRLHCAIGCNVVAEPAE